MRSFKVPTNSILILALVGMFLSPSVLYANELSKAKVLEVKGEAVYLKSGSASWQKLDHTIILEENDSIKTAPDAEVRLELMGSAKTAEIVIGKDTQFKFGKFRHDDATRVENTLLNVEVGRLLVKAEKLIGDSKFEVKTPTSIVGIRGTVFEVNVPKAQ